ncbi:beta-ketoacyl-[acyl-carrier-protein] synthase family protein [bacterium]|nr:beta-ketoacyl-[acyl-carrier-protein] synthase family protein [bacterium]
MRRVVITGRGVVSPFGAGVTPLLEALQTGKIGVCLQPAWHSIQGMHVSIAAPVPQLNEKIIPRPIRRTMGRVSILASLASRAALEDARLDIAAMDQTRIGLYMGSTTGSLAASEDFFSRFVQQGMEQTPGTEFMKIMSHTTAVNVALYLGIRGRVESLSAACATASQTIGAGFEAIRYGILDTVIAGGAEELHPTTAGTFDILAAASRQGDPEKAPRLFDQARDGLVLGEGAGVLVLEEREQARRRGATIFGEVKGYASVCSADHMTAPSADAMQDCMQQAMRSAEVAPIKISAVNAHATGTLLGDASEASALQSLFDDKVAVTAFKGSTAHTLAAAGGIESIGVLGMMEAGQLWPIRRLDTPLAEGRELDFVRTPRDWEPGYVMKNSFAFGGINVSLVLAPPEE